MTTQNRTIQATIRAVDSFTSVSNRVIQSSNNLQSATSKIKDIAISAKDMASSVIDKVKSKIMDKALTLGIIYLEAKDKASAIINKVKSKVMDKALTLSVIYLSAKDKASATIEKVRNKLSSITNSRIGQIFISAKDKASATIGNIASKLKSLTSGTHNAVVSAKDNASSVLGGVKSQLMSLAGGVTVMVMAKIGFDGLAEEQNQKITINRVIQNAGTAKEQAKKSTEEYYKYLEDYANRTPFSTADVSVMGTKSMMMAKGNVEYAKTITDAMANTKAFVGNLRTSDQVAKAFFSASNGNMQMLNNMLGEEYTSIEDALDGIQKKQGGLVDEMSRTVGGLWSTVLGKAATGLKDVVKQFQPMIEGVLDGVIGGIDTYLPIIIEKFATISNFIADVMNGDSSKFAVIENIKNAVKTMAPVFQSMKSAVIETVGGMFTSIQTNFGSIGGIIEGFANFVSPIIQNLMPVFSGIGTIFDEICSIAASIWPVISGVITTASEIIGDILIILNPIIKAVGSVCSSIGKIISAVWPSIQETIMTVWDNLKPVFELFEKLVKSIANFVEKHWPTIAVVIEKMWEVASVPLTLMSEMLGKIADFVQTVWDKFKGFNEWWNTTKWNPTNWFNTDEGQAKANAYGSQQNSNAMNQGRGGSHAYGLKRVPVDGYKATLHEGERVLTKQEANQLDGSNKSSNSGITVNMNGVTIREEADIEKIASAFIRELRDSKLAYGGEY